MNSMIENYINGNLSDAKKQAKRHTRTAIAIFLEREYGWSSAKAFATASYLKGMGSFQAACDAA
jgi:hypothetical protein